VGTFAEASVHGEIAFNCTAGMGSLSALHPEQEFLLTNLWPHDGLTHTEVAENLYATCYRHPYVGSTGRNWPGAALLEQMPVASSGWR
jgi:hypothetical protein